MSDACLIDSSRPEGPWPTPLAHMARNPEWTRPRPTHYREITGGLAYWAVRQIDGDKPYFPPKLEGVVGFLSAMIRPRFDQHGWAELSLAAISQMLHEALMPEPMFQAWGKPPAGLDLDGLIRNVCLLIRDERWASDSFERTLDAYGRDRAL